MDSKLGEFGEKLSRNSKIFVTLSKNVQISQDVILLFEVWVWVKMASDLGLCRTGQLRKKVV
jgi:hypothetical protein